METSYHRIIDAFVDKYGLSRGQVIAEIERTFSSMLSGWYQKNVVVIYSEERFLALSYHESSAGPVQMPLDLATMRGWNTIKRILDKNLSTAACLDEVSRYKRQEHNVVWGEVQTRSEEGLGVLLEMEFGVSLLANCPLQYLGQHERHQLILGDRRAFHLRRVEPIMVGDTPRTQLTVDRVSKTLVEQLLKHQLGPLYKDLKLQCRIRYVGKKSFVETNTFLPKKVILNTSQELGEHIQVKVVKRNQGRFL